MRNDFNQVIALEDDHKAFVHKYFFNKQEDSTYYERMQIEQSKILWLISQINKKYDKVTELSLKVTSHTEMLNDILNETLIKAIQNDKSFKNR